RQRGRQDILAASRAARLLASQQFLDLVSTMIHVSGPMRRIAAVLALGVMACQQNASSAARVETARVSGDRGVLPGVAPFDPALVARLHQAWEARPKDYKPRTRHLLPNGEPQYTNRL